MSETKEVDRLLSSLLSTSKKKSGPLVSVIGEENVESEIKTPAPVTSSLTNTNEGPSMLEMMMAAQADAKKDRLKDAAVEEKKNSKSFGQGFKKGFFSSSSSSKTNDKSTSSSASSTTPSSSSSSSKTVANDGSKVTQSIPTITKKKIDKSASLVIDEVQKAMEEENPALRQLKKGEDDSPSTSVVKCEPHIKSLSNLFIETKNDIIAAGLRNPKCMTAMQLMQEDPKEAQKRYQGDPEVDAFMREFGRVMAGHFDSLGSSQQQQTPSTSISEPKAEIIKEIGPLHADVLKRQQLQQQQQQQTASSSVASSATNKTTNSSSSSSSSSSTASVEDESRVQEVLNDPELRELLMDPKMQQILVECGDPAKFQMHMRDPNTARKIKKLWQSGLVGTAS